MDFSCSCFYYSYSYYCNYSNSFSPVFGNKYWGYYPPKWWSRLTCWLSLCSVKSSGHENLDKDTSYVFIANHQGAFDIFLIYGFLNHNIKWMQKIGLRKLPFVGKASEIAGHVFVDNSSIVSRRDSIVKAKEVIEEGVSIIMFPEVLEQKMEGFHHLGEVPIKLLWTWGCPLFL